MKILPALAVLCLLVACQPPDPDHPDLPDRPNVIFIVADDLGWNDLSSYGNRFTETPHLDAMARDGIRFTNAYAAASLCSPSRAALMTGLHPVRVNITEHMHGNQPAGPNRKLKTPFIDQRLRKEFKTVGELAKQAGYRTGFFGKWHLGGGDHAPDQRGFDVNVGGSHYGLPGSFFYPFFRPGALPALQDGAREGDYLTDVLTDHALDFLNDHRDTSFLLYLAYYSPHVPIEGKAELVKKYQDKRAAQTTTDTLPNPHYAAMVESIDQNVGRVVERVRELGLLERTLIFFTSDNGGLHVREVPAFAQHTPPMKSDPLRAGKGYLYEGGMRVPYIVYGDHLPRGDNNPTPILGQDLFNTFAELTNQPDRTPDGESLVGLLRGDTLAERPLFWHVPHYSPQRETPVTAMRRGRYKLVQFYEDPHFELYDLDADLGETQNLIDRLPDVTTRMQRELAAWKRTMGAREPEPNPEYGG